MRLVGKKYIDTRINYIKSRISDIVSKILKLDLTKCDKDDARLSDTRDPNSHTHIASDITENSTHRFVTDTEKSTWNGKADSSHNHDSVYATADHTHAPTGSTELIDAPIIQTIPYESTPTPQSIHVQINDDDANFRTLTLWRGYVNINISDVGCNVTSEDPYIMSGSVLALNQNLANMTVTVPSPSFPMDQSSVIKVGVDGEEKEIMIQPLSKRW